jgi:hypothetical protein
VVLALLDLTGQKEKNCVGKGLRSVGPINRQMGGSRVKAVPKWALTIMPGLLEELLQGFFQKTYLSTYLPTYLHKEKFSSHYF